MTAGRVVMSRRVEEYRGVTVSGVGISSCVAGEGSSAAGCIVNACGVAQKRLITDGRVIVAGCDVIEERLEPDSGVAGVASGVQRSVTHTRLPDRKLKHPNSRRPLWPGRALWPGRSWRSLRPLWSLWPLRPSRPRVTLRSLRPLRPSRSLRTGRPRITLRPRRSGRETAHGSHPKLASSGIHQHRLDRRSRIHADNPSKKRRHMHSWIPYANRARFARHPPVANVNVVIARGKIAPRIVSQGNVAVAGGVVGKGKRPGSGVADPGRVVQ